jgi:hypothetical protein
MNREMTKQVNMLARLYVKALLLYVVVMNFHDLKRFLSFRGFSWIEYFAPTKTIWHYLRQKFYSDGENLHFLRTKALMDQQDDYTTDEIDGVVESKESNEFGITGTVADFGPQQTPRFIRQVVSAVKMKFGVPKRNEANRMAIRDYAVRIMKEVGHRPSHIVRDVPLVVRLAFQPTSEELVQARLESHPLAELDRARYEHAVSSHQN